MRRCLNVLYVFSILSVASCSNAVGARLVKATIKLDGTTVLEGTTGDNGRADSDTVWTYLKVIRFHPPNDVKNPYRISNTATAILRGKIEVNISFGGRIKTKEITVKQIFDRKGRRRWRLTPEFVDATINEKIVLPKLKRNGNEIAKRDSNQKCAIDGTSGDNSDAIHLLGSFGGCATLTQPARKSCQQVCHLSITWLLPVATIVQPV